VQHNSEQYEGKLYFDRCAGEVEYRIGMFIVSSCPLSVLLAPAFGLHKLTLFLSAQPAIPLICLAVAIVVGFNNAFHIASRFSGYRLVMLTKHTAQAPCFSYGVSRALFW
jgi:hypothetical protein